MSQRDTVAYWLDYYPNWWASKGMYSVLIEELEHGLPKELTVSERNARLQALYRLVGKNSQPVSIQTKKKR